MEQVDFRFQNHLGLWGSMDLGSGFEIIYQITFQATSDFTDLIVWKHVMVLLVIITGNFDIFWKRHQIVFIRFVFLIKKQRLQ